MAKNEKLVAALGELEALHGKGDRVIQSRQLSRVARERLIRAGFLLEVIKGWLVSTSPATRPGDTTPWFASFWEFCAKYCRERFGDSWHLSPEQSLLVHGESSAVPKQALISSPAGNNARVGLLFETSLFVLKEREMPPRADLIDREGVILYSPEAALVRVPQDFFERNPIEAEVVLRSIGEPSGILLRLLEGGHSVIAGRLAGAFRHIGGNAIAEEIVGAMVAADHHVRERNPFDAEPLAPTKTIVPPIVARLQALWRTHRDAVIEVLPASKAAGKNVDDTVEKIDEVYALDAYHSLSIEGYEVTPELVARVASGEWDPENVAADAEARNALAARGYWLAFQAVRDGVLHVLRGQADTTLLRVAHRDWYRQLFAPHVTAGVLTPTMLAGYRNQPVFLRGSRHIPPRWETLRDAMPALFDLIEKEPHGGARAILGHWLLGYIHPFPDGNGRVARFLMNVLLVAGGYPWTVIRNEDRATYLASLERASVDNDVEPFVTFVSKQMALSTATAKKPRSRR